MNLQEAAWLKRYEPEADFEEYKREMACRRNEREPFRYHLFATVVGWVVVALIVIGAWKVSH